MAQTNLSVLRIENNDADEALWKINNHSWMGMEIAAPTLVVQGRHQREAAGSWRADCLRVAGNHDALGSSATFENSDRFYSDKWLDEAIQAVDCALKKGIRPSTRSLFYLVQRCIDKNDWAAGKEVHGLITRSGFESNAFLGSHLIRMFSLFGSLLEADNAFSKLVKPNVFSWSAIIMSHVHSGQDEQAIKLYHEMQMVHCVRPDDHVFIAVLTACAKTAALIDGKLIHASIIESGFESHVCVHNSLINMYAKCGSLLDARMVLDKWPLRDIVAWNAIIAGYGQHGYAQEALQAFQQMEQEGTGPDEVTYISLLGACSSISTLEHGKLIHAHMTGNGIESVGVVGNSLLTMYAKCGSLPDACMVFDRLSERDVVAWNAIIAGYNQHGLYQEALDFFHQMQKEGMEPSKVTFISTLKACTGIADLQQGQQMHSHAIESGFESDLSIGSSLIDMYAKFENLTDAHILFGRLPKRDAVLWTALIAGIAQHGHTHEALYMFQQMHKEGTEPNNVTYVCILKACSNMGALEQGKLIHNLILQSRFLSNVFVGNSLIDMYAKCGSLQDARVLFDKLQNRDIVTWNAMIAGYSQHGYSKEALQLYQQMKQEGFEPNQVTFICILKACRTALHKCKEIHVCIIESGFELEVFVASTLIDMYGKSERIDDARVILNRLPKRNVVTWNALIGGYAEHGLGQMALHLFQQMEHEGIEPDRVTFVCILEACSSIAAFERGKIIHNLIIENGFESEICVSSALIDMYSKCGSLEDACLLFDRLPRLDVVTWSSMITGCALSSNYRMASQLFEKMQLASLKPNDVTFVSLLSACSHAGLVDQGFLHFKSMREEHSILPTLQHYDCMVELLGHAGFLKEAVDLLDSIPFQCNVVGWTSLLGACRKGGMVSLGRQCFDQILKLDLRCSPAYAIMASIYANAGMQEDVEKVEQLKKSANVWKKPAKAFIEVDNHVHDFIVGDRSHPQSDDIYKKLNSLDTQMREEGYTHLDSIHNSKFDETGKEDRSEHCEKLAVAFGLLCTPPGTTVRVAKNIRVCADCHTTIKIISKIELREIIVTDAYCIHQLKDGVCTCKN